MVTDAINYRGPTVLRYFAAVCRNILDGDNDAYTDARTDAFEREPKIDRSPYCGISSQNGNYEIPPFVNVLRQLLSQ